MRRNPAIWISLIGAALAVAAGFGLKLSGVQSESILNLATIAIPLIIGGTSGAVIRSQVYNADAAQKALDMPVGSTVKLLDKVIANDVEVRAGDTQAEVVTKLARIENAK